MSVTTRPSLEHELQLIMTGDTAAIQDPYPVYQRLREESPVHRYDARTVIVSRYRDVKDTYRDELCALSLMAGRRVITIEAAGDKLAAAIESALDGVKTFADDRLFYFTSVPLAPRELPTGKLPTQGSAQFGGERGLVSNVGLGKGDDLIRRLAKHAVHQAGHLWELHHCLDGRCSMFVPWAEQFAAGDPVLCSFCREKSEKVMQR